METTTRQPRAIVTYARSMYSLAAIRCLGQRGIEVIAGDEIQPTPGALSKFSVASLTYASAEREPRQFVLDLIAGAKAHRRDSADTMVVIPMHRETYALAEHRDLLPPWMKLALVDFSTLDRVRDKGELVKLCLENNVGVPKTTFPRTVDELETQLGGLEFPVFVKAPRGAGGVGLHQVENAQAARDAFNELTAAGISPIMQEGVPGEDYCVSTLFDRGRPVTSFVYRNRLSFPSGGGPGAIRESVEAPELVDIGERFLSRLKWHGIAQLDFRWAGEGTEPMLIEINPRFFGGLAHAISAGVDYPYYVYQLALGQRPKPGEANLNLISESPLTGFLATIADVADHATPDVFDLLKSTWQSTESSVNSSSFFGRVVEFAQGATKLAVSTATERAEQIRLAIESYQDSESSFDLDNDPMPLVGLVYPLALLLRDGTLSSASLTGVSETGEQ